MATSQVSCKVKGHPAAMIQKHKEAHRTLEGATKVKDPRVKVNGALMETKATAKAMGLSPLAVGVQGEEWLAVVRWELHR